MSSLERISPYHVLDTHALIWYLTQHEKLGKQALAIFEAAERGETWLIVPAISIAEMYYVNKKHTFFDNFDAVYHAIKSKPYFALVDFSSDDVLQFDQNTAIPEMHDRIITGLARRLNVPLVTADSQITASKIVEIIW